MLEAEPKESENPRTFRIELTARSALVAVATIVLCWLFLQLWQILLVVVVAMMFVGMLNPAVDWLTGRVKRRGLAVVIVFGTPLLVVGAFSAFTVPQLVTQVKNLTEHFEESQARLAQQLEGSGITAPLAGWVRSLQPEAVAEKAKEWGLSYGPRAAEIVAYGLSAFFLALYLSLDLTRMRGAMFAVVPRAYHLRLSRVLMNLERIVGGYMRGQVITSLLMAAFTFVVLLIARVPNAGALALVAGLADVLPYIGAFLACGPAVLAALSQGTTTALVVLGLLAGYQELESRIIVPRIYGQVLRLPAATVMLSLLLGGKLLGVLGALLALPIAAGIRMVLEEMRVALPGEDAVDELVRARDAEAEAEFETRAAGTTAVEAAIIATQITHEHMHDGEGDAHAPRHLDDEAEIRPDASDEEKR